MDMRFLCDNDVSTLVICVTTSNFSEITFCPHIIPIIRFSFIAFISLYL